MPFLLPFAFPQTIVPNIGVPTDEVNVAPTAVRLRTPPHKSA